MPLSAQKTYTTGATLPASDLNTYLRDWMNASPMELATAAGQVFYATGTRALAALAAGTTSQVLRGGTTPSWGAVPVAALPSLPKCKLMRAADKAITASTDTTVDWDNEIYDTDTMHDNATNNTRLTFTTAGYYHISALVRLANLSTGNIQGRIVTGGAIVAAFFDAYGEADRAFNMEYEANFGAGTYVELVVRTDDDADLVCASGAGLSPDSFFAAHYVP